MKVHKGTVEVQEIISCRVRSEALHLAIGGCGLSCSPCPLVFIPRLRSFVPDAGGFFGMGDLEPRRYQLQYIIIRPKSRSPFRSFPLRRRDLFPEFAQMNHFTRMLTKTILKDFFLKTRIPNVRLRKADGRLRRPGNHHFPPVKFKKSDGAKTATEGVFDLVEIPVSLTTNLKVEDTAPAFPVLPVSGETSIHSHPLLGKRVVLCCHQQIHDTQS